MWSRILGKQICKNKFQSSHSNVHNHAYTGNPDCSLYRKWKPSVCWTAAGTWIALKTDIIYLETLPRDLCTVYSSVQTKIKVNTVLICNNIYESHSVQNRKAGWQRVHRWLSTSGGEKVAWKVTFEKSMVSNCFGRTEVQRYYITIIKFYRTVLGSVGPYENTFDSVSYPRCLVRC